jgi:hypothetical protein
MAVRRANDAVAEALFEYVDLLAMSGGDAFQSTRLRNGRGEDAARRLTCDMTRRGERMYLRGELPSPALPGSGLWGSPTGVSFSACYGSLVVSQTVISMRAEGTCGKGRRSRR